MSFSQSDRVDLFFVSLKYYEPRDNYTLSLNSSTIIKKYPAIEGLNGAHQSFELQKLFNNDGETIPPNYITTKVRVVSIIKIEKLDLNKKDPLDLWRVQLLLDDSTAVLKGFLFLKNLLNRSFNFQIICI